MSNPNQPSLNIPGDTVNRATANLPDKQRSAIRWLHSYAIEQGWSQEETGKNINKAGNTIYQLFTGRHNAGKDSIVKEIESLRKTVAARAGTESLQFIETDLTRRIWQVCDGSLVYQRIAFIFGDSQIGKTTALMEYQRTHNHGSTIYVRMPAGGRIGDFLRAMCKQLNISNRLSIYDLKARIKSAFDHRMVLIVDEAHQAIRRNANNRYSCLEPYEFLREIHDEQKCGLVISATNVFRDEMIYGKDSNVLTQLSRRRLVNLQLPNEPAKRDLKAFAAAYGLEEPEGEALELQKTIIKEQALGVWLMLLRMTAGNCSKQGIQMTWDQVIRSHDIVKKWEG